MSSTKMNIPDIINVGYQERNGTYTGKLAYVVYTDSKGKLRKENSIYSKNLAGIFFDFAISNAS